MTANTETQALNFVLNGQPEQAPSPLSVQALLERFDLQRRRVAVAINTRVVPRSQFTDVQVEDGDRIEVIQAVGGG